jgi:hypothetical protein
MKFYNFLVYDPVTRLLKYSKFNFNFETYNKDFPFLASDKNILFEHFWSTNNYSYETPFIVYKQCEKYFEPMTDEIRAYVSKYGIIHGNLMVDISTNVSEQLLIKQQFDLIPYTEINYSRIVDFLYVSGKEYSFTKYNFDFDQFSIDFGIFDNKLVMFTDFMVRNYNTSGVVPIIGCDGLNPMFTKYFKYNSNLEQYLFEYSVHSTLQYATKNYYDIDFVAYFNANQDLPRTYTPTDIIEHYIRFGQFETRIVPFIKQTKTAIQQTRMATCSVFLKNKTDTPMTVGFLYSYPNDESIYVVTVYHLIKKYRDQRYVYGIFEEENKSIIAQFKIIGYDIVTDILVGIYDYTLNFNVVNKVDMTGFPAININYDYKTLVSETVSMIGNIGYDDNLSFIDGKISSKRYSGGFDLASSAATIPESLLIQSLGVHGMSGSPVCRGDPLGTGLLECIGMVVGGLNTTSLVTIAIDGYLLANIVTRLIQNWNLFVVNTNVTDQSIIDNFVKNGFPKTWLGVTNQYNHPIVAGKYKELANLSYVGGLLITNFIIGFNVRDETFVYSSNDLVDRNVIKINGPLLKSTLYNRFITNGSVPLVIVSISYFNSMDGNFIKSYVGKFGKQTPYSEFVYGNNFIAAYDLVGYYNKFKYQYAPIRIEYYYYNGESWLFDTELIGGNDDSWYTTYSDNAGNLYFQHMFEFPQILGPFSEDYSISKYGTAGITNFGLSGTNEFGTSGTNEFGSSGINAFGSSGVGPFGASGVPMFGSGGVGMFGSGGMNDFVIAKLLEQLNKNK